MSKRKPWFEARNGWYYGGMASTSSNYTPHKDHMRVRLVDARELTPEKAVQRVLQALVDGYGLEQREVYSLSGHANMSARVVNGKVRVTKADKPTKGKSR